MPSLASAAGQQSTDMTGFLILLLPLLLIGLMFWSQRRRAKHLERVQSELEPGAEISTTSGLRGTLISVDADIAEIEAAPGVRLRFDRRAVLPVQAAATAGTSPSSSTDKPADEQPTERPQGD